MKEHISVCRFCGRRMVRSRIGRPRMYHHTCAKYAKYLSQCEKMIRQITFSPKSGQVMKSTLFGIANSVKTTEEKK